MLRRYDVAFLLVKAPNQMSELELGIFEYSGYIYPIQGELRRGGLTPALVPRMPVITEDIRRQIETVNATAKGYSKSKSCLNEEKGNTEIALNEPATIFTIRRTMANSSRKQQHCCCSNSSITIHRAAAAAAAATLYSDGHYYACVDIAYAYHGMCAVCATCGCVHVCVCAGLCICVLESHV